MKAHIANDVLDVLPILRWCVTHAEITETRRSCDCCRWVRCSHVPRCDLRLLLIEPAHAARSEEADRG